MTPGVTASARKRLASLLQAEGARVTLTRTDDTFIALKDRSAIAAWRFTEGKESTQEGDTNQWENFPENWPLWRNGTNRTSSGSREHCASGGWNSAG